MEVEDGFLYNLDIKHGGSGQLIQDLKISITNYILKYPKEQETGRHFLDFINGHDNWYSRANTFGHFTGSAFIVNKNRTRILLTHHRKLDKWIQLGGHADGDEDIAGVALKEAEEESGLTEFSFVTEEIFDIDRHAIPAYQGIPEHYHFDIRYLMETDDTTALTVSDESHDLAWAALDSLTRYTETESMLRMARKLYDQMSKS